METTKTRITIEQISEMLRDHPETRDDTRVWALRDLVNAHEAYTENLEWLARKLVDEVEKNRAAEIRGVHESIMRTSLIDDITIGAAKIVALRQALGWTCKAADDPKATPVDELIRTLDPSNR